MSHYTNWYIQCFISHNLFTKRLRAQYYFIPNFKPSLITQNLYHPPSKVRFFSPLLGSFDASQYFRVSRIPRDVTWYIGAPPLRYYNNFPLIFLANSSLYIFLLLIENVITGKKVFKMVLVYFELYFLWHRSLYFYRRKRLP